MHIWRRANPICPACGMLVEDHSAEQAFNCEETIHNRLIEMKHVSGLLQDARSALAGRCCEAGKNGRHKHGKVS